MESKKSNFSGFLDGYKAGNLASMSSTFRFKKNEIKEHIVSILSVLNANPSAESANLSTEIKGISSSLISHLDSFDVILSFGESLGQIINSYKKLDASTQSAIESDLKKIVYHFIDLAKKSEDQKNIEMAIEIGERF